MENSVMKIVLADDDPDDRELFRLALGELPLQVELKDVENGAELMSYLAKEKEYPDVLFLDINMPKISGIECLKEIRQNKKLEQLYIIMFSTSAHAGYIEDTFTLGANLYITKPNNFQNQVDVLNRVLTLIAEGNFSLMDKENYLFKLESLPVLNSAR